MVPVRDIRLIDDYGRERLVRIKGELIAGNVVVGDVIEVEGVDRYGTLLIRNGWNHRTGTEIRVNQR